MISAGRIIMAQAQRSTRRYFEENKLSRITENKERKRKGGKKKQPAGLEQNWILEIFQTLEIGRFLICDGSLVELNKDWNIKIC